MRYTNLSNHLNNQITTNNFEHIDDSLILGANKFINESVATTTAITSKRLAMIYISKAIRFAKKYFKIAFKIFIDLNMYEKLKDLDNSKDALSFIRSVVTDKNTNLNNPKDIAIVTAIILAIWYITKWKKSETEQYIKTLDASIYNDIKPELALIQ